MEHLETVYCSRCKKGVQYHYDPVNHWKELLVTIFTFGMWLPMWLCMVFGPTKMCNECNGPLWDDA
ncbi:MAG: hypothetical protein GXY83_23415 [Rhodopirellula sp.]|nr:hypothetical protein [Rhodopirellula sp.]